MEIAICFPNGEDLDSQSSPFSIQKATIIQIHEYFREFSWVKPPQRLVFIMQMFYKWMKMKWLRVVGLLDSVLNTCKLYLCSCFSSLVGLSFDSLAYWMPLHLLNSCFGFPLGVNFPRPAACLPWMETILEKQYH
jgi:hypothetical protein